MKDLANTHSIAKPYKGPDSYQVEDEELFFGRDREADQLIAKILSSRLTLLHAQSGAGKTSLLNARIIPELESRGWIPIRILPENDPIESTRLSVLRYLLPPPEAELQAIARLLNVLGKPDDDPTLNQLLLRYDRLTIRDESRRQLIAPIEAAPFEGTFSLPDFARVTPYVCRVLRSSVEIDTFAQHLAAIDHDSSLSIPITDKTPVSQLCELLSMPEFTASYRKLVEQLDVPVAGLKAFFKNLVETYLPKRLNFALVLIFDQFEELFTRFIDPGPVSAEYLTNLPDWRLRWDFFDEIKSLYATGFMQDRSAAGDQTETPLPLRYVFSMRSEYIAQLDPIRQFVWDLNDSSYHLDLLGKDSAKTAIQEPAKYYGYTYADDCYNTIIAELTKEDRYVEPAHLQIVCEKLWNESGQELAAGDGNNSISNNLPEINLHTFEDLGGTKGILKSFFYDFLDKLRQDERLETLEMLEPLITGSGTRNIMEREQLVNAPFRDGTERMRLLSRLVDNTIVRVEKRLGGYFVEITHEFLIWPILEALRGELYRDPEYNRFRMALRSLERYKHINFRAGTDTLLMQHEIVVLDEYRHRIQWVDWATELMFRSVIIRSAGRDTIRVWSELFSKTRKITGAALLLQETLQKGKHLLTIYELQAVNEQRATLTLSSEQIALLFRSELVNALSNKDRDDVEYWTRRLINAA